MPLQPIPISNKPRDKESIKLQEVLCNLVNDFNAIPEHEVIHRIFCLQKINYFLNKIPLTDSLYSWLTLPGDNGWEAHLLAYSINPKGSFFLKGVQFANAVSQQLQSPVGVDERKNEYTLMQERDFLLKEQDFEACKDAYIAQAVAHSQLAKKNPNTSEGVKRQLKILELANDKFEAIEGRTTKKRASYATQKLTENQVNNYNFKFNISHWPDPLVFRIEDRGNLGLEQELHSAEVSNYFIEDFAVFMMGFSEKNSRVTRYKPVVLSQYANGGNLAKIAHDLQGASQKQCASQAQYYFLQLSDFLLKLMAANAYHPDIKLANILVHNKQILISDRKTLIDKKHPLVEEVCSSPAYAPNEYLDCLNLMAGIYNPKAHSVVLDMTQFMSYQLGMALKEFLILTKLDKLPADFRKHEKSTSSYFVSPSHQITNLSLLIQELTRSEEMKRLEILSFQKLLPLIHLNPNDFYKKLESLLPSAVLGIEDELKSINDLMTSGKSGSELLSAANLVFGKILERAPQETRLRRMAEKLAIHCYKTTSQKFFDQCSKSIEKILLNEDWPKAPWYRKLAYYLTFGYYRVARVTNITELNLNIGIDSLEFQPHLPLLEFLPPAELNRLGLEEASNIQKYISTQLNVKEETSLNEEGVEFDSTVDELDAGTFVRVEPGTETHEKPILEFGDYVVEEIEPTVEPDIGGEANVEWPVDTVIFTKLETIVPVDDELETGTVVRIIDLGVEGSLDVIENPKPVSQGSPLQNPVIEIGFFAQVPGVYVAQQNDPKRESITSTLFRGERN